LLLNPNTVVPTERIIDAVWDESPPATARTQVQIQISGLRQLFRRFDGEPVQISTVPGGYITRVDPDDIDCAIFERRVHEAFALISRDRLIEANTELRGRCGCGAGARWAESTPASPAWKGSASRSCG